MSVKSRLIGIAARVGKKALKNNKRFKKYLGKAVGRKAMSSAQKSALKKAVKASALARRKSIKAVAGKTLRKSFTKSSKTMVVNKPLSYMQTRKFVNRYAKASNFSDRVVNGKTLTAKVQAKSFGKVMKAAINDSNSMLRANKKAHDAIQKGIAKQLRAERGGIDWVSSIGWSVALTAAVNPSYTMSKLEEAKNAIKRKL